MVLASEILNALVEPPVSETSARVAMQLQANMDINNGEEKWFENLIDSVSRHRQEARQVTAEHVQKVIASSEAIRYVQLGSPETILISSEQIHLDVMSENKSATSASAIAATA